MTKDLFLVTESSYSLGVFTYEYLKKYLTYKFYYYNIYEYGKDDKSILLKDFVKTINVIQIARYPLYRKDGRIFCQCLANVSHKEIKELASGEYKDEPIYEVSVPSFTSKKRKVHMGQKTHTNSRNGYTYTNGRHSTGWKHSTKCRHQWQIHSK